MRSKGRGWESYYVKQNYGTFAVEMRAYGQKLVQFCKHTHTHTHTHIHTRAAKLVVEMTYMYMYCYNIDCVPSTCQTSIPDVFHSQIDNKNYS